MVGPVNFVRFGRYVPKRVCVPAERDIGVEKRQVNFAFVFLAMILAASLIAQQPEEWAIK